VHQLVSRRTIVLRRSLPTSGAGPLATVTANSMNVQGFAPALQAAVAPVTARVTSSLVICENVPGYTTIGTGRQGGKAKLGPLVRYRTYASASRTPARRTMATPVTAPTTLRPVDMTGAYHLHAGSLIRLRSEPLRR